MITIDMTRREGDKNVALVELSSKRKQKYIVRTDLQHYQTEEFDGVTFIEQRFDYKPSIEEVKEFVIGVIDNQTDEKILDSYEFTPDGEENPIVVWLSKESQTNFSEAHRLQIVPVKFKLNETADKQPIYHTFETFEELNRFYVGGVAYINQCLNEGWAKKDSIDWTPYEQALNAL